MSTLFNIRQNSILFIVSCFCIFYFLTDNLSATTYYVSTTGNDNYSGTSTGSPWRTISKAANTASAGDTVYIKAGNYGAENVVVANSGTSGNPITFEGYKTTPGDISDYDYTFGDALNSTEMPLLDGVTRATEGVAIDFNQNYATNTRSYITLKNILIQDYNMGVRAYHCNYCIIDNVIVIRVGDNSVEHDGEGITVGVYSSTKVSRYNIVRQCVVANACNQGLSLGGDYNTIEDCEVYCDENSTNYASTDYYLLVSGNHNTVSNSYVERSPNLYHPGHGFQVKGTACEYNLIKNCIANNLDEAFSVATRTVKYNTFEDCLAIGGTDRRNQAINIRDGASFNTFRNIRSINTNHAVFFYDGDEDEDEYSYIDGAGHDNIFENCIFESTDSCIRFDSFTHDSRAYYNDFINCVFDGGSYLFQTDRLNSNNALYNCIVYNVSNQSTGSRGLHYESYYSDFYGGFSPPPDGTYDYGVFSGNFDADPKFVDASNGDFRLKYDSPCIDAGTNTNMPDIDCVYTSRPQGDYCDVGAYEYNIMAPLACFSFDGGCATDATGNLSDGTKYGTYTGDGIRGDALFFDGSDDYVDFGTSDILRLTGSRSISAWIKPDTNGEYNCIVGKYIWGYSLHTHDGYLEAYVEGSTSYAFSRSGTAIINTGEWQHVAMAFNDAEKKIRLYYNGEEVSSYSYQNLMVGNPVNNSSWKFTVGSDRGVRNWFDGAIDEVRLYDRVVDFSLCADWHFNDGTGRTAHDSSAYGNDAFLSGGMTPSCWVTGHTGNGLRFGAVDGDYLNCGKNPSLSISDKITIDFWFKPDSYVSGYAKHILYKKNDTTDANYDMYFFGDTSGGNYKKIRFYANAGGTWQIVSPSYLIPTLNQWYHIVWTYDSSTGGMLYVNGESQGSAVGAGSLATNNANLTIDLSGVLDELKIYNRVVEQ